MSNQEEQKTGGRKHPGGRPTKYKEEYVQLAEELCREKGYTDKNIAQHFKVSERTINQWKRDFPQFLQSLKKGKDEFDKQVVEQSLLKRALGYRYTETTRVPAIVTRRGVIDGEGIGEGKSVEEAVERSLVITKQVTKEVIPDVTAQIFWLKNRQPVRWSDKKEIDHRIEGITEPLTEEELLERLKRVKEVGTGIDYKSIEGSSGQVLEMG